MIGETADGEAVEVACVESDPMSAFVFKTVADPFVGKMSYIKVFSGKLTPNKEVVNATTGSTEKVGKACYASGQKADRRCRSRLWRYRCCNEDEREHQRYYL